MRSHDMITLVALQIEPLANLTDTFRQISHLVNSVNSKNETIDCIVLPEYTFGTFREWATTKQDSDQQTEHIQSTISKLAEQYGIPIVAGSVPFQTEDSQWRNRSFFFSAKGAILGHYDKQRPFRAEKRLGLEPGTQLPTFKLGHLRMAILICSDLWHHDLVSQVASVVDFIAVPTMTTVLNREHIRYGQWAWQSLVAVRAKEYTIPIVSADQASREYAPGIFTCGGSCIADPSHRFSDKEGPSLQALRITPDEKTHIVTSNISFKAIRAYAAYRREVGLRE